MNLANKISSLCDSIDEMEEISTLVKINEESITLSNLVSERINLLIDKLNNNKKFIDKDIIYLITKLQEKYLQNPEQIANWSRIELFEAIIMLENIKLQLDLRN